jgi:hypothetical protein
MVKHERHETRDLKALPSAAAKSSKSVQVTPPGLILNNTFGLGKPISPDRPHSATSTTLASVQHRNTKTVIEAATFQLIVAISNHCISTHTIAMRIQVVLLNSVSLNLFTHSAL